MKVFYKKGRSSIVLMLVLAMLLQIVGPVVSDYVYAEAWGEDFEVKTTINGDGTATVDWKYKFTQNGETRYDLPLDFTLTEGREGSGDLKAKEGVIGEYTISKDGEMTVRIDKDTVKELLGEIEDETTVPLTPLEPSVPVEPVPEPEKSTEDETNGESTTTEPETNEEGETEGEDSARIIENLLGLFSKNVVYTEGNDEEVKPYDFTGSFEVGRVQPIEDVSKSINQDAGVLENIFIGVILKVKNEVIDENTQIEITEPMEVYLEYTWEMTDDQPLKSGDTASIRIPDFFADFFENSVGGEIISGQHGKVGQYVIYNNILTFIFDDTLEDKTDRSGTAGIRVKFDLEKFEENVTQEIDFGYDLGKTTLTIKPKSGIEITKNVKDPVQNDKVLEWTINVNTKLEELENAVVVDTDRKSVV